MITISDDGEFLLVTSSSSPAPDPVSVKKSNITGVNPKEAVADVPIGPGNAQVKLKHGVPAFITIELADPLGAYEINLSNIAQIGATAAPFVSAAAAAVLVRALLP